MIVVIDAVIVFVTAPLRPGEPDAGEGGGADPRIAELEARTRPSTARPLPIR